jgi:uncharacterized protein
MEKQERGRNYMEDQLFIHEYKKGNYPGAMAIIGFPSAGLVSSIAANFITRSLKLERVATILSRDFPPYALIHEGEPVPPVRIYAGTRTCDGSGEQCEQIVVVTSEFVPAPPLIRILVEQIMSWCKDKGIGTIVSLEGMNVGENPELKEPLGVASGIKCRKMLRDYSIKEFDEGMVSGLSGVLLYEGDRLGFDTIVLLGPARQDYPDARGAARLLEIIGRMLPELKLDPEPLFKEAEQIEKEMKAAMESVRQASKPPAEQMIYG